MKPTLGHPVELREAWAALFPNVAVPADSQFALWLMMHSDDIVREGMVQLATKRRKLHGQMDADYMIRFASAVMNRLTRERQTAIKEVAAATQITRSCEA